MATLDRNTDKLLDRALTARAVFLGGEEDALRREWLAALFEKLGIAADDFEVETFLGDASAPPQWSASAGTAPFLSPRRVALVRHCLRRSLKDVPEGLFRSLPETALLILVADDESGDESRQRDYATARAGWKRRIEAEGGVALEPKVDPRAVQERLKGAFAEAKATATPRALETLVEMCGGNLSRALGEAEKLILYVGENGTVSETVVRDVVVPSREWNVFRLVDAVASDDMPVALRQLATLVGSAGKPEESAFRSLLPMLSRQLRLLWQARALVDAGTPPEKASRELREQFPDKPNLFKEQPYRQQSLMRIARSVSAPRLARAMAALMEADGRLKGQGASVNATETLERMLLEIAQAMRPSVKV